MEAVSSPSLFSMIILFLAIADLGLGIVIDDDHVQRCSENGPAIRFPFRFTKTDNLSNYQSNLYPGFDILCSAQGGSTILELKTGPTLLAQLYIRKIDYASQEIQVSYDQGECLPTLLLSENNSRPIEFPFEFRFDRQKNYTSYTLFNCSSVSTERFCSIKLVPSSLDISLDIGNEKCTKMYDTESIPGNIYKVRVPRSLKDKNYVSLTWSKPDCRSCEANSKGCRLKKDSSEVECFDILTQKRGKSKVSQVISSTIFRVLASSAFCSILAVAATFYFYSLYKDDKEHRLRIEKFLEDYIALKPSRYTYADIKRITNQFNDKLGQGAYGIVFKGKLSSDVLVAVKILNNSKGNGEEFINEVATMGQIHHVNVVRLVGYCAEGFRRALVYEFLPNDSLDKYISSKASSGNHSLSWKTLQHIAMGIAKGIEYLHHGCDQRILHFDIKPHNVLLDHNFKPKISDFGLAKLCSKDQSIVSMTTVRGTIGYIAPEVFSKNFGNVSYKSDVYSFGMLLLEMVGGRKNTTVTDEIYYPEWIYNLLEEGEDLRIQIEEAEDAKIAKKLAIVGLWCIQWHPMVRPTMNVVVQMLEGEEVLNMPPNPFDSTGQSKTNSKMSARPVTLEFEAIPE